MKKAPEAFRTISEVSEILETPAHVLRFWESKFYQIRPVKRAGGRRYYRPDDVALINGIRTLLQDQGMTIRGVQRILQEQGVKHVAGLGGQLTLDAPDDTVDAVAGDAPLFGSASRSNPVEPDAETHEEAESRGVRPAPEPGQVPEPSSEGAGTDDAPQDDTTAYPEDDTTAYPAPDEVSRAIEPDAPETVSGMGGVPDSEPDVSADTAPELVEAESFDAADEAADGGADVAPEDELVPVDEDHSAPVLEPDPPSIAAESPAEADTHTEPETLLENETLPSAAAAAAMELPVMDTPAMETPVPSEVRAMAIDPVESVFPQDGLRIAKQLRNMRRGELGRKRDSVDLIARRIDALLERMSEASGAGRW